MAHLRIAGANAAFRSTVNLTVLSVRASRDAAVRLTALPSSRQLADAPNRNRFCALSLLPFPNC